MSIADDIRNLLNTVVSAEDMLFMHLAVAKDDSEFAEALLARGTEVSAKGKDGFAPLPMAAWQTHQEAVEILLTAGADAHAKDVLAEMMEVFLTDAHASAQQDETPLHEAAGNTNVAMAVLWAAGAEIHASAQQDETPLHEAAGNDSPKMVEVLMSTGADIHLDTRYGSISLYVTAQKVGPAMVEVLVSARAQQDETPLQGAERTDNPGVIAVIAKLRRELDLAKPIAALQLSVRVSNCLETANIKTIRELVRKEEKELLEYKNLGRISLRKIKFKLAHIGLTLGMNLEDKEH